jgi:hypothetical protein
MQTKWCVGALITMRQGVKKQALAQNMKRQHQWATGRAGGIAHHLACMAISFARAMLMNKAAVMEIGAGMVMFMKQNCLGALQPRRASVRVGQIVVMVKWLAMVVIAPRVASCQPLACQRRFEVRVGTPLVGTSVMSRALIQTQSPAQAARMRMAAPLETIAYGRQKAAPRTARQRVLQMRCIATAVMTKTTASYQPRASRRKFGSATSLATTIAQRRADQKIWFAQVVLMRTVVLIRALACGPRRRWTLIRQQLAAAQQEFGMRPWVQELLRPHLTIVGSVVYPRVKLTSINFLMVVATVQAHLQAWRSTPVIRLRSLGLSRARLLLMRTSAPRSVQCIVVQTRCNVMVVWMQTDAKCQPRAFQCMLSTATALAITIAQRHASLMRFRALVVTIISVAPTQIHACTKVPTRKVQGAQFAPNIAIWTKLGATIMTRTGVNKSLASHIRTNMRTRLVGANAPLNATRTRYNVRRD